MERDTYPYLLAAFIRRGEMDVRYRGETYIARKGDVLLMDCRHPHYYRAHNGLEFLYVHFDGASSHEMVNYIVDNNGSPIFRQESNIDVGKLLYDVVQHYEQGGVNNAMTVNYQINQVLYWLSTSALPAVLEDSPIDNAIHYIRDNVGEPITLDDLAQLTNFSPCYLSHTFKKQTGYAPSEYVINTRLEKAQMLLTHSRKSVNEIAFDVGYSSASSFINVFTRKVGCTPKVYRNMQQSKSMALAAPGQ